VRKKFSSDREICKNFELLGFRNMQEKLEKKSNPLFYKLEISKRKIIRFSLLSNLKVLKV
jgi:hypothetical protein